MNEIAAELTKLRLETPIVLLTEDLNMDQRILLTTIMNDLLLGFYGDDFTGSTDAMDALARAGVETILFLSPPSAADIAELEDVQVVGVAGTSRSLPPDEMEETLDPAFETLSSLDLPLVHYKVCSTFDSAPEIGSIGKAIDISAANFESSTVPLLPGAPPLGRYVVFGNMFAEHNGDIYRLDRHPAMSDHPVTPMNESDLRRHLSKQTDREMGLVNILQLRNAPHDAFERAASDGDIVFFDSLETDDLATVGRLLWDEYAADASDASEPTFLVGSSGVEYALSQHWQDSGLVTGDVEFDPLRPVDRAVVMSGSASPVTETQIDRALENGFDGVRIRTENVIDPAERDGELSRVVGTVTDSLSEGNGVVMFTAKGPDDPAIERTKSAAAELRDAPDNVARHIGETQGEMLGRVIRRAEPSRVCIAGGDTCGHVAPTLGIDALEMRYPLAPGSPVCRTVGSDSAVPVEQIALKSGQLGCPEYFLRIKHGTESKGCQP